MRSAAAKTVSEHEARAFEAVVVGGNSTLKLLVEWFEMMTLLTLDTAVTCTTGPEKDGMELQQVGVTMPLNDAREPHIPLSKTQQSR